MATARAFYRNISPVSLQGKKPTQVFQIAVGDDGKPLDVYWRKRLTEGVIAPHVKSDALVPSSASPGPASDTEASPKKSTSKKGA